MYGACMDTGRREALGVKPVQAELDQIGKVKTREELKARWVAGPIWGDGRAGLEEHKYNCRQCFCRRNLAAGAGILLPRRREAAPMFDMETDDAANYGAIGAVIGHEMGHGFDDQGSQFDCSGNLKNWWTAEDRKKFEARAECVIDQFNRLDVGDNFRYNGRLVVGEALGDMGGVGAARDGQLHRRSTLFPGICAGLGQSMQAGGTPSAAANGPAPDLEFSRQWHVDEHP